MQAVDALASVSAGLRQKHRSIRVPLAVLEWRGRHIPGSPLPGEEELKIALLDHYDVGTDRYYKHILVRFVDGLAPALLARARTSSEGEKILARRRRFRRAPNVRALIFLAAGLSILGVIRYLVGPSTLQPDYRIQSPSLPKFDFSPIGPLSGAEERWLASLKRRETAGEKLSGADADDLKKLRSRRLLYGTTPGEEDPRERGR
jgi:hypothetical protein